MNLQLNIIYSTYLVHLNLIVVSEPDPPRSVTSYVRCEGGSGKYVGTESCCKWAESKLTITITVDN
jgi:hypothetical protein